MHRLIFIVVLLLLYPLNPLRAQTQPGPRPPEYELSVSFTIPASRLTGLASLRVVAGKVLEFNVRNLSINKLELNGRSLEPDVREGRLRVKTDAAGVLEIRYEAEFRGSSGTPAGDIGVVADSIGNAGISLTGDWYPRPDGLARYRLRARLPKGYEAVSEADSIEKTVKDDGLEFVFRFDHPVEKITLAAAAGYEIFRDRANGTDLFAYFFPEDRGLAKTYLQHAKKYLAMYEKLLGRYPYKRFAIVENFLPSGCSLPTFTLLGKDVVRLPFIPATSLGHEIVHQWLGNSVYIDTAEGNWAEGITTYLSDHLYEEREGRGWEYRKQLLLEYGAAVTPENEISLRQFMGRTDRASRSIGYGKAAMVFHMLRKSLSEDVFFAGLRLFIEEKQFRKASWNDIRTAFEEKSGRDLGAFFKQWIDEKGLPQLKLESGSVVRKGDSFEIRTSIGQEGKTYALELPAQASFMRDGTKKENFTLDSEKKSFTLTVDREPAGIVIDPDYDVARKLAEDESPPRLAVFLADPKPLIVLPVSNRAAYAPVVAALKERGGETKEAAGLKDAVIKSSSLAVMGEDNPVIGRLFGRLESVKAGFGVLVKKNPWNADRVIVLIHAGTAAEALAAFPKLSHYGRFGALAFDGGRNVSKKTEDSQRGMAMELREPATAVDLSGLGTLSDAIRGAEAKKIVYVGEFHDRYAHHQVQLQVIRELYEKDAKIAIGMEMFQRPFQKVLDDYISGSIDERTFLRRTEYFKRWVFDFNLYKPILDFAKNRKIPVVALNQEKEITDKVAKSGLDSLTDDERKQVPGEMDFSDNEYRDRLKAIFEQHKPAGERSFEFFYQAQVLWDETMAMSVDEFLQKNPGCRMIVVAGGGHLAYGSGIPKRVARRNGLPYFIILNDGDAEKDIADYLVLPQPLEGISAPKLMVGLKVENNRVMVTELPDDSVSGKAGVKAGDTIMSIDGEKVESVEDIRLVLFYKKHGDAVKVKVLRKRFLVGDKEREFEVKL